MIYGDGPYIILHNAPCAICGSNNIPLQPIKFSLDGWREAGAGGVLSLTFDIKLCAICTDRFSVGSRKSEKWNKLKWLGKVFFFFSLICLIALLLSEETPIVIPIIISTLLLSLWIFSAIKEKSLTYEKPIKQWIRDYCYPEDYFEKQTRDKLERESDELVDKLLKKYKIK